MLGRPTEYPSGKGINWSDANLRGGHAHTTAAPELQDTTKSAHANDTERIGPSKLLPTGDRGLTTSSRKTVAGVKAEINQAKRALSKGQVAAEQRFDRQSGLGGSRS
jgi:hypothetical protein